MSFNLVRTKTNLKENYKIICDNIPTSIFAKLGFSFVKKLVMEDVICVYNIIKNKKIVSIITVINYKNYLKINKKILFYLLLNPLILIKNFFHIIYSRKKSLKFKITDQYLHLLHLIIIGDYFKNISKKKKDKMFNMFFKRILTLHRAKIIFLCFNRDNIKALKFYSRNSFSIFYKTENIIYCKKKYN